MVPVDEVLGPTIPPTVRAIFLGGREMTARLGGQLELAPCHEAGEKLEIPEGLTVVYKIAEGMLLTDYEDNSRLIGSKAANRHNDKCIHGQPWASNKSLWSLSTQLFIYPVVLPTYIFCLDN